MVSLFCFMLFATFEGSDFAFAKVEHGKQGQVSFKMKQLKHGFSLQEEKAREFYSKVPFTSNIRKALQMHIVLKNDKDFLKVNSYAKLYAENFTFHNLKTENEIQRIQNT